jgi:hypothetical protein
MTHTWYFCDDNIVDFHHPGDPYPWLSWNARPERKHLWLNEDQAAFVSFGTPVYAFDISLSIRRYFPDPELSEFLVKQVTDLGGVNFFKREGWQDTLLTLSSKYRSGYKLNDRRESEGEYQARVRDELSISKEIIEANLKKRVNFLCWPGGGYNDTTERIAKKVGYLAATLSSSRDPRWPLQDSSHISRAGAPMLQDGSKVLYRSTRYLVSMLRCIYGSKAHCFVCKLLSARDKAMFQFQPTFENTNQISKPQPAE